MIPAEIRARLRAAALDHVAALTDPAMMLRAVEELADQSPGDLRLRGLIEPLHGMVTAEQGLPAVVGKVRRGELVRWDAHTITVLGHDTTSGAEVMARTLRAHSRHPTWRRSLIRDGQVLAAMSDSAVRFEDGEWPVLVAPLTGGPLLDLPSDCPEPVAMRIICRLVADLAEREAAGLPLVRLGSDELRVCSTGARVQCLTVDDGTRMDLGQLAGELIHSWPTAAPLHDALMLACQLPAERASDLADQLQVALAQHLAGTRHQLVAHASERKRLSRSIRLHALTRRLGSYAPPSGRGAVGVDMDGKAIVLVGDGTSLRWGPLDGPFLEVLSDHGLHVASARRLLRTRASSPLNDRLQNLVSGERQFTEQACRWVAAALALRTIQKLLEATR